ncbi:MAG: hypothetical protein H7Y09_11355 [Chitinophagaceae bacterium]|nr:hypothetical protein [Anaerolineae bacterium]
MNEQPKPNYLYLDGVAERQQLISEIGKVRQSVLQIVTYVPEAEHYEARYHGWSLAAMLAHLNIMDTSSLWLIKASLLGLRPSMSLAMLNRFNDSMARIYQKRIVSASLKSMNRNEKRIADFITHLPESQFSKSVFHPNKQQYMTVERAIQDLFLYHWGDHLRTMQEVEGIQPKSAMSDE